MSAHHTPQEATNGNTAGKGSTIADSMASLANSLAEAGTASLAAVRNARMALLTRVQHDHGREAALQKQVEDLQQRLQAVLVRE